MTTKVDQKQYRHVQFENNKIYVDGREPSTLREGVEAAILQARMKKEKSDGFEIEQYLGFVKLGWDRK